MYRLIVIYVYYYYYPGIQCVHYIATHFVYLYAFLIKKLYGLGMIETLTF